MEGFLPSSMEDDVNLTSNQFDIESLLLELELLLPPPEVPVNQSSISCNDQGGQSNVINDSIQQTTPFPTSFPETMTTMGNVISDSIQQIIPFPTSFPETMTTMGGLDGTSSSWINQNEPTWPKTPSRHQNSFIHQPQPGHGYMTPNTTTSQHAGFNQPGQSFPATRIQFLSNQGQVDQAVVSPDIDNMQQDNFMPRNSGSSTRSRMDNLQVRGLQNQTATPNASNTQQVETVGSKYPFRIHAEYRADGSMKCKFCQRAWANKTSISRFKWHLSGEEGRGVAICREVSKEVKEAAFLAICGGHKRQKITASSVNVNDCGIPTCLQEQNIENENTGGGVGRVQREVQVVEPGVVEERISSQERSSGSNMRIRLSSLTVSPLSIGSFCCSSRYVMRRSNVSWSFIKALMRSSMAKR